MFYCDSRFGDPIPFDTENEMLEALREVCELNGWTIPEDGFREGRDYYEEEESGAN